MNDDKAYEIVEIARNTGKIVKGVNETSKAIEKGKAKLVVVAEDCDPKEIMMHLPMIAKEKGVLVAMVKSKEDLGAAAGLSLKTAAVAVVKEGDAKAEIESLKKTA